MKTKKIKLLSTDFTYPSKEERFISQKEYPKIGNFGFQHLSTLNSILVDNMQFEEASKKHNLFYWDMCLSNRLGLLNETYVYTITYFNRLVSADYKNYTGVEHVNQLMFGYHAEIFYYYFISVRDIIAQIISLYYDLNINGNIYFNPKFIKKINDLNVKKVLETFLIETKEASKNRNEFAHKFTPTQEDFRIIVTKEDGQIILSPGNGQKISSKEIIINMNSSLTFLSMLMSNLKKIMK